ncbi:PAS domain-containing sensor histidine kinase [Catenovulum agarivorans]|uniref:PAS domain-containing sensor histidine kinase n=1 Tax=Catenovulum agarivorans TaxID=1172192 RepID=UPI00035D5B70|nr:PAS domain-containing sensor histidine kinase [Catenovulum agarivorans]
MPSSTVLIYSLIIVFFLLINWLYWLVRIKPYKQFRNLTKGLLNTLKQNHEQIWLLNLQNQWLYYYDHNTLKLKKVSQLDWDNDKHLRMWLHIDDIQEVKQKFKHFLDDKSLGFCAEFRLMIGQGKFRWVQLRGQCLTEDADDIYMYGLLQNIEKLVDTETQLKNSQHELAKTQCELDQTANLTYDALTEMAHYQEELLQHRQMSDIAERVPEFAHEINTPIGICVTATSHLKEAIATLNDKIANNKLSKQALEKYQSEMDNTLSLIASNIERAADLIQSFKQITTDQTSEQLRSFKLATLVKDTLNTLHPKLKKTQHSIEVDIPEQVEMFSYPGPLSQVFINLINNSLTHGFKAKTDGNIKISVFDYRVTDKHVLIVYADNGSGVEQQDLDKIFTPYYTTNRDNGNTGLGMSICKSIICDKLAGEIVANSDKGCGFEMYIRIPTELKNNSST